MKKLVMLLLICAAMSASATTNWNNPTMGDVFHQNGSNGNGNSENSKGNQGEGNNGNGLGNQALTVPSVPLPAAVWMFGSAMMGYLFSIRRKSN